MTDDGGGRRARADFPELAGLLDLLSAPGRPDELGLEELAVAAFRARPVVPGPSLPIAWLPAARPRPRRPGRPAVAALAVLAIAAGGVATTVVTVSTVTSHGPHGTVAPPPPGSPQAPLSSPARRLPADPSRSPMITRTEDAAGNTTTSTAPGACPSSFPTGYPSPVPTGAPPTQRPPGSPAGGCPPPGSQPRQPPAGSMPPSTGGLPTSAPSWRRRPEGGDPRQGGSRQGWQPPGQPPHS